MRTFLFTLLSAGTISIISLSATSATPVNGSAVAANRPSEAVPVRMFCHATYTSRFLHWGACGWGDYYRYRRRHRYYCYDSYTGRFLHRGRC
jgi:hypothetical protein